MRSTCRTVALAAVVLFVVPPARADVPLRKERSVQLLLDVDLLIIGDNVGWLPGVSYTHNVLPKLGINVDLHTLFYVTTLGAGLRYYFTDGAIAPYLGARVGAALVFAFGGSGAAFLVSPNAGIEFTAGYFSTRLEGGAAIVVGETSLVFGEVKLGLGVRY